MPAAASEGPSCSWTRRTALPSTRAASYMLAAFQIVIGSASALSIASTCRISRTDCATDRFPAVSNVMKRSPGFS